jgi:hypothetical protein
MQTGAAPMPPRAAVTPQDIADSQAGKKFIYIYGWVRYRDIFPRTEEHITRFCWLIVTQSDPLKYDPAAIGNPPAPGTLNFSFIQHREGNCTDEECET